VAVGTRSLILRALPSIKPSNGMGLNAWIAPVSLFPSDFSVRFIICLSGSRVRRPVVHSPSTDWANAIDLTRKRQIVVIKAVGFMRLLSLVHFSGNVPSAAGCYNDLKDTCRKTESPSWLTYPSPNSLIVGLNEAAGAADAARALTEG